MQRAALLTLLVVTAGCLGGAGPGTSTTTESPHDRTTTPDSPTASAAECEETTRATVDPFREEVTPSDRPEPPVAWTRERVREYVVAFEKAYARNEALRRDSTQVTVVVRNVTVERSDGDWTVRLEARTNTWAQGRPDGTETATVVHGDGAWLPVAYAVTDDRVVRAEGDYGTSPDPGDGSPVECL